MPFKSWLDAGILVTNGTDTYPWNPFLSLWAMNTRTDGETGAQLGTDECVTRVKRCGSTPPTVPT